MTLEILSTKGLSPFVVSKHPKDHLRQEAQEYGIEEYFSGFLGEVSDKALAILTVCKRLKIPPTETAYLGDMIYDIEAAKSAGARAIGIATGYHSQKRLLEKEPDVLLNSLSELVNWV